MLLHSSLHPLPLPLGLSVLDCTSSVCEEEQAAHTGRSHVKYILTCSVDKVKRRGGILIHGAEAGIAITAIQG